MYTLRVGTRSATFSVSLLILAISTGLSILKTGDRERTGRSMPGSKRICERLVGAAAIILLLCFACTSTVTLDSNEYENAASSGGYVYRVQTTSGACYVIEKFEFDERGLVVLANNQHAGSYDTDGQKDPDPPYVVPLDEIVSFESTRHTWNKFLLITISAAALIAVALFTGDW